jgi:TolB-like protein/tetratricopeptide (TPR) repeat protein
MGLTLGGVIMQLSFGDYVLDINRRELTRDAELISVGPQVFDLLVYLVQHRDRVVSKDDLTEAIWNGRIVSESTLTSHINAVRKAIGDNGDEQRLIRTIPRKGLRFIGSVKEPPVAATSAPARETSKPSLAPPDRPSIAILPFQNLSGDPEQDYFADGMVEDIITGLSRIKWLSVVAGNSTFRYKGSAIDVKHISRELGVRYVLEGSVRKAADRVRITAQLIDATTGAHVWAERYDRRLDDIFALQDEITLSIVGAIEPSLRDAEIERVRRKRPDSLDAYDLVLRATPHIYMVMPGEAMKAVPLLEEALALDPGYAGAHGLLAWCHEVLFVRAGCKEENRLAAIRHARAAVSLGRDDATALALGAFVIAMVEHDRDTAIESFEQALALSPSSSYALFLGCAVLAYAGEAERAIDWGTRALRISPFDRLAFTPFHALAVAHFMRGRYEEAANAARRAIQFNPNFSVSHSFLAAALAKLGRIEEAKAAAAQVLALDPSFSSSPFCAAIAMTPALTDAFVKAWGEAGLPP